MIYNINMLFKIYFSLLVMCNSVLCNSNYSSGYMEGKVVGGVEVPISMYPHVASIVQYGYHTCGSSIISHRVTLTAAHCLFEFPSEKKKDASTLKIIVGSSVRGEGKKYTVCQILANPKYNTSLFRYDIGLVLVKTPFIFGPNVQKIPLVGHKHWQDERHTFSVAGFGAVTSEGTVLANKLLASRLHYVDFNVCKGILASIDSSTTLHRGTFCSLGRKWTSDCQGDSGSGIVWKKYLVGAVSAGLAEFCGVDGLPSLYTNVYYFTKWIKYEVKKLEHSRSCHE